MDRKDDLERLHENAVALQKSIDDIDLDIERATHALAAGETPGPLISYLTERHDAQLGFMYSLGQVEARFQDLQNLVREGQERPQERQMTDDLQHASPVVPEDHLDWFKQSLAENPPQHDARDAAEQRMLEEVEREPSHEDHLDWLRDDFR